MLTRVLALSTITLAGWSIALGAQAPAAAQTEASPRPNILLITVDTLRPDALGWVAGNNATPILNELAAGGVAFPAAVAPAPLTLPAHTSIFSGLVPRRHGVRDNHQVVGASPALLAERLAAAGYDTAAAVSGFPLTRPFGLDRGFAHYDDQLTTGDGAWLERPADQTTQAARSWLAKASSPWFLWVHYYDPHFPYEPPEGFERPGRRGAYDGEVAWVDQQVGELMMAARDSATRTAANGLLTLFTADHGEALGEHDEGTHGFFIYDDTVLVPMIVHWPGRLAPGRSEAPARLIDTSPTVLDLLGLEPMSGVDGVSLADLLRGGEVDLPPAYVETLQPWYSYGWAPLAAVRDDGWKLVAAPRPELYDLSADPGEAENLFGTGRAAELKLRRELRAIEARAPVSATGASDPEALGKLRALGYLGSPGSEAIPPRQSLPDPKDQGELRSLLTEASALLQQNRFESAVPLLRQVLAQDSSNRFAQARLGVALSRLGHASEARTALQRAIELAPEDPEVRFAYAELLTRNGEPGGAVQHWLELVRLQPERITGWANLGAALGLSGAPKKATEAYRRAVELEPEVAERWVRLAFAAFAAGESQEAVESLERAARMEGEAFEYSGTLGLLMVMSDRAVEALPWLERSTPQEADFGDAQLALARLLIARGEIDQASEVLRKALALQPSLIAKARADDVLREFVR